MAAHWKSGSILGGNFHGGLDIREYGIFPEFPVCPPVFFFGEVICKVCVVGHLAYFLIY